MNLGSACLLDAKVFMGPARIVAGCEDEASIGLASVPITDDCGDCWCGKQALPAYPDLPAQELGLCLRASERSSFVVAQRPMPREETHKDWTDAHKVQMRVAYAL